MGDTERSVLWDGMSEWVKSLSHVRLFATLWTVAPQVPLSLEFSRQEYLRGLPFPSPGDLPYPEMEPGSSALQADFLLSEPPGKPYITIVMFSLSDLKQIISLNRKWKWKWSRSVMSDSLRPHGLQPTQLLRPWDFPGKNTGVGCHFLLQGIFPTQGSNQHLLHWQANFFTTVSPGKLPKYPVI